MTKTKIPLPNTIPPPANGNEVKKPDIPEIMPSDKKAVVSTNIKYEIDAPTQQKRPISNQIPFNPANFNASSNFVSDNPFLDFIEYWKDDDDDCYVLATRLPDNPLSPNEFYTPCTSAKTFPIFPFNPASLLNDLMKINGNSGGYFKLIIVDESMQSKDGETLKRFGVGNPPINSHSQELNQNNNSQSNLLAVIQQMNEKADERFNKLIETLNANKKDEFGEIAKTLLTKKLENIDKPPENINSNPMASLPPETQALVSMFQNPVVTKGALTKINESLSTLFSDEKTGDNINKAVTWGDRIITVVMDNPELQGNLMSLADKAIGLIGLGLSKIGNNRQNPEQQKRRKPQQQQQQNPVENPINTTNEENVIDIDAITIDDEEKLEREYQAEKNAFLSLPLVQNIIAYIDSDEPLQIDNDFMRKGKELNRIQFVATKAVMKEATFDEALELIYNDFPYVEDLLDEVPRRLERLKEFHELLKTEN